MGSDFSGETAVYYARYRRGYPPAAVDAMAEAFGLGLDDLVVDLGCGTGQLSVPLAARARAVVGVDPEPDMLMLARRTATEHGVANVSWLPGADTDVPCSTSSPAIRGPLLHDDGGPIDGPVSVNFGRSVPCSHAVRCASTPD